MAFIKSISTEDESVTAVMQNYPKQVIPLTQFTEEVMRTGECNFSAESRELIAAFSSGTNACTYCYNTHKATAEAYGVDENLLGSLLNDIDSSPVDDNMKPVLRYVKKLTESPSKMVQSDVDAILDAGWDENDFHYVVMICGLFNLYNRMMDGYGVENTAEFRASRGRILTENGYFVVTAHLKGDA
jgi:uncharacterized peroxidase-related enzyme